MRRVEDLKTLNRLRKVGGTWAAYENQDFSHPSLGEMKFLRFGEGCTFEEPPKPRLPDTANEIHWRHQFVGVVDLETGIIEP